MIDETTRIDGPEEPKQNADRVGFCQDCGRPLTRETVRAVGSGMFCEPCLEARLGATSGAGQRSGASVPPQGSPAGYSASAGSPFGVPPSVSSEPSPTVAALLGMIPGVGAMYNGQYAKGGAHLLVFIVLMSLSDHVSGIFGLLVFGWWCYMILDAYHTARARRDGSPLPDPFGFNDIGEKMGFGKNWGVASHVRTGASTWTSPSPTAAPNAPPASSFTSGAYVPPVAPPTSGPDWIGYVPPTSFGGPGPVNPYAVPPASEPQATQTEPPRANWGHVPYAETYTGTSADTATTSSMPSIPPAPVRRFPMGALWLIALGALFLMSNWMPFWRLNGSATVAILMAGLAAWLLVRRLGFAGGIHYSGNIVCSLRGPVVLLTLAIIFGLQSLHVATFAEASPLLLVTLGVVLLLERTVGIGPVYIPPPPGPGYVPPMNAGVPGSYTANDPGQSNFGKGGL